MILAVRKAWSVFYRLWCLLQCSLTFVSVQVIILGTVFAAIVVGTLWGLWPYEPIQIKSLMVQEPELAAKEAVITLKMDYCKPTFYQHTPATVRYIFKNSLTFESPSVTADVKETGCHVAVIKLHTPEELITGSYHITRVVTYEVNPMRSKVVTTDSNKFQVVRAPEPASNSPEIAKLMAANRELVSQNRALVLESHALVNANGDLLGVNKKLLVQISELLKTRHIPPIEEQK